MTKEQAKQLIPLLQRWIDGEELQEISSDGKFWIPCDQNWINDICLNPKYLKYLRIKPKPEIFWVAITESRIDRPAVFDTEEKAKYFQKNMEDLSGVIYKIKKVITTE